jgi:saccharopine dehydrogenase-like NADP-dependent oxidoreductase
MVPELGKFESYANRDSLGYISPYGIDSAHTVLRGTLRRKNYSQNWNYLVKLGLTDDTYKIANSENMTYRELMAALLSGANQQNLEIQLSRFMNKAQTSKEFQRIKWLGLLNDEKIGISNASPAQILQHLLTQKWKLKKGELDMIVMKHEITYKKDKKNFKANSSLIVKGEDEVYTAMAKTVGLPMAIAAKLILQGKIIDKGVQIPLSPMYYEPILKELKKFDINFVEH